MSGLRASKSKLQVGQGGEEGVSKCVARNQTKDQPSSLCRHEALPLHACLHAEAARCPVHAEHPVGSRCLPPHAAILRPSPDAPRQPIFKLLCVLGLIAVGGGVALHGRHVSIKPARQHGEHGSMSMQAGWQQLQQHAHLA